MELHHHPGNHDQDGGHHHHEHHGKGGHGHSQLLDLVEFLPKITSKVTWGAKNENVLDYGCGPGTTGIKYILPDVLKHDSKMYGVDVNEKGIDFAKANCDHPSVTYAVGDILHEFPFSDVKFDKIFAVYVFHFVPDLSKALKGLYDLLKPGGQIAYTMHKTYYFNAIRSLAESDKWKEYTKGYDNFASELAYFDSDSNLETFRKFLEDTGFKVVHTESQNMERTYEDFNHYLGGTMSTFSFIDNVPTSLREDLREDLRTIFAKLAGIPRDSTKFPYTYQCIGAVGVKPT